MAVNAVEVLDLYKRKRAKDKLILIPILDDDESTIGFLRPITADFDRTIPDCVQLLDRWRADNPTLSPSRFPITHERTRRWITESIINNDKRILFMIQDLSCRNVGHIGFTNIDWELQSAEVDLVLRGERVNIPGFMRHGMAALIQWGTQDLLIKHIDLVVLPYNEHAISFYQSCGFQKDGIVPLLKVEDNDEISWIRCKEFVPDPEFYFLHMSLHGTERGVFHAGLQQGSSC